MHIKWDFYDVSGNERIEHLHVRVSQFKIRINAIHFFIFIMLKNELMTMVPS